ncbi:tRNA uridine-5-carboxymethylaminomethyl(34) synthesis enzyme MnmG, partial [Francisella tularensis subsp. holarctica]|nr:tRNA uridine-5-carboxymethylaminomethyl(34) synthesis enzyme MnmG [Francisella tularensis subsp. holarctica]
LKRTEIDYTNLQHISELNLKLQDDAVNEQIEISAKYSCYIDRQNKDIEITDTIEKKSIPPDFNYSQVIGLSNEVIQKL